MIITSQTALAETACFELRLLAALLEHQATRSGKQAARAEGRVGAQEQEQCRD